MNLKFRDIQDKTISFRSETSPYQPSNFKCLPHEAPPNISYHLSIGKMPITRHCVRDLGVPG